MRELESRLAELEGRHSDLSRSYESLQVEYSSVKSELDRLRKDDSRLEGSSSHDSRSHGNREWDESKVEIMDPLLFDVSAFCFDHGDGDDHHRRD
jgi:predicted nuclease with TOPRIM domain